MNSTKSEVVAKVLTLQIDENPLTTLIESCIGKYLSNRQTETPAKEYVSQKELCQRLGLSTPTVIDLRKKGIIQGVQIGNKWRFEVSEVWQALRSHQNQQAQKFSPIKTNGRA
jgi:excisionase family DNA binding protein